MKCLTILLLVCLLTTVPAAAQDGTPPPFDLVPITADNANQVQHLTMLGGGTVGVFCAKA
jgi:hypothetical protein